MNESQKKALMGAERMSEGVRKFSTSWGTGQIEAFTCDIGLLVDLRANCGENEMPGIVLAIETIRSNTLGKFPELKPELDRIEGVTA